METRETYTTDAPDQKTKLLRLAADLHEWFEIEAKRQHRSINAEMLMALEYWRKMRETAI